VAVVVGWDDNITVQYEGKARILDPSEHERYREKFLRKQPSAIKHDQKSDQRYLLITPVWLRYSDFNLDPWLVEELSF
jgi:hypothetical protein